MRTRIRGRVLARRPTFAKLIADLLRAGSSPRDALGVEPFRATDEVAEYGLVGNRKAKWPPAGAPNPGLDPGVGNSTEDEGADAPSQS